MIVLEILIFSCALNKILECKLPENQRGENQVQPVGPHQH